MQVRDVPVPKNNREASTGPYAHKWHAADRVEMEQMFDKGVLEPVNRADIPPGHKPIPSMSPQSPLRKKDLLTGKFLSNFL